MDCLLRIKFHPSKFLDKVYQRWHDSSSKEAMQGHFGPPVLHVSKSF